MTEFGFRKHDDGSFETRSIHRGSEPELWNHLEVVPPIVTSSTFKQPAPGEHVDGFDYGRHANPTRTALETCLASLEGAKYGLAFSSGLGALTTVGHLLRSGDHVLCIDDVYAGVSRYFTKILSQFNVSTSFADFTNVDEFEKSIKSNTRMVWAESPTNPLLKVVDFVAVTEVVRRKNKEILLVVDNTFLTSYFQKPLDLGFDISVYSLSKFFSGHHDVIMGAICTNNDRLYSELHYLQKSLGIIPSPFDCSLVIRSLKTLKLRMDKHMTNGVTVARYLEKHPGVIKVMHPGLESHPQHDVTKKQTYGHSGLFSFYIRGGLEEATKFTKGLKMCILADSLGGVATTLVLPAVATRGYVDPNSVDRSAISDNLIRLSVGIEEVSDIISDLDQALNRVYNENKS